MSKTIPQPLTVRLDPGIQNGVDVEGQTFAIVKTSTGHLWACLYNDLSDRPQFSMSDETLAASVESKAKHIDSFEPRSRRGSGGIPARTPQC